MLKIRILLIDHSVAEFDVIHYEVISEVLTMACVEGGTENIPMHVIKAYSTSPILEQELPKQPIDDAYQGLKNKYNVTKPNGEHVYDCFVLRPQKDPAARAALKAYAEATTNKLLAEDLRNWVRSLHPLTLEEVDKLYMELIWHTGLERGVRVGRCNGQLILMDPKDLTT